MRKSKSRGWYVFADGYCCWYSGMSAAEKKVEIRKHGVIIDFQATD